MNFYENTRWQKAFSTSAAGTAASGRSCDSRTANASDEACRIFGVGRTSIHNWLKSHQKGGDAALKTHKRGPKHQSRLAGHQAATVVRLITDRARSTETSLCSVDRDAVRQLIENATIFGFGLDGRSVFATLGFTPQKPLRRAYEQDPQAVQRWLEHDYPAIHRQATQNVLNPLGRRNGNAFGPSGRTQLWSQRTHARHSGTGQRFGCNMISTVTNRGRLPLCLHEAIHRNGDDRLSATADQTKQAKSLFDCRWPSVIVPDRSNAGVSASKKNSVVLPARYSPQLNPDELLIRMSRPMQ